MCLGEVEDRFQGLIVDLDMSGGGFEHLSIGCGEEENRLLAVVDLLPGERRLVIFDQVNDVVSWDVVRGDDHDAVPVEGAIEGDAPNPSARHGRADRLAVPCAGKGEVVGVAGASRNLTDALASRDRATNGRRDRCHWVSGGLSATLCTMSTMSLSCVAR